MKGELLAALAPDGLAIVNADDPASERLAALTEARVILAGRDRSAEVRVQEAHIDGDLRPVLTIESPWGTVEACLQVRGEHQIANAALAVAVALGTGVPPEEVSLGIAEATSSRWRLELSHSPAGLTVLNDAYNANPASMEAALRSLARIETSGRRVAVLGEMRELGCHVDEAHAAVGRLAAELGIDVLVATGDLGPLVSAASAGVAEIRSVADAHGALEVVAEIASASDVVLVKASRAVGLEIVATALVEGAADAGAPAPGIRGGGAG
ncbi:MAG: Mur ligase family protein [Acidimicrobiia bacterium]|nr:Mur ligase family protein [Acidimicrobiia bacterium]